MIDVSDSKQSQAEKERLELQLRQAHKMEAIGTLAGGIAHDFNNILGAIVGYGELAQQRAPEGSALRRYLDGVMQAAERARALVDRILGFSRSGAAERVPVHVQQVVEETLQLLRASLPPNVRLDSELKAADLVINPNTVAKAYRDLEHDGVIELKQGAGEPVRRVSEPRAALEHLARSDRAGEQGRTRGLGQVLAPAVRGRGA